MSKRSWENKKAHRIGKYTIYSTEGAEVRRWYIEVHVMTRHGLLYRDSFGSNLRYRWMAVGQSLIRYKWGKS